MKSWAFRAKGYFLGDLNLSKIEGSYLFGITGLVIASAWANFNGWLLAISIPFGLSLVALSVTDVKYYQIPNVFTGSILIGGLITNSFFNLEHFLIALLGSILGFVSLWVIRILYFRYRNFDGIGGGDLKLFAAAGAWVGISALPFVLGIATLTALFVHFMVLFQAPLPGYLHSEERIKHNATYHVPFGPYLAAGLWFTWCYM